MSYDLASLRSRFRFTIIHAAPPGGRRLIISRLLYRISLSKVLSRFEGSSILKRVSTSASVLAAFVLASSSVVNAGPVSNLISKSVASQNQETKEPEKRAQALKKYLEAQRLERDGNYSGAVAALKEATTLDPQSV